MTEFTPEEFLNWCYQVLDLEFICIAPLELHSAERNDSYKLTIECVHCHAIKNKCKFIIP